jgi:carbon-monoxide dehydrogenase small subunit
MTMQELVRSGVKADREQLRELLSGNLCRCTGYETILDALEELLNQDELGVQHG